MSKVRLDQILQTFYPDWSRSKLQALIEQGCVEVFLNDWKRETRPGAKFDAAVLGPEKIRIAEKQEFQFVSRGALKLKEAIEKFSIPLANRIALDVGLSTGGFSDYLLKNGISRILGVDVGKNQLHPSLVGQEKLLAFDKVNARDPIPAAILDCFFAETQPRKFDVIVVDVSFISLSKVVPSLVQYLAERGDLITLVKPQFELTKADLNKKGVVKTEEGIELAKKKTVEVLQQNKLQIMGMVSSPIEGENGNKEFLIWSQPSRIMSLL